MEFWSMAYRYQWVDATQLKGAVITDTNKFGEITPEQYKDITGIDFAAQ